MFNILKETERILLGWKELCLMLLALQSWQRKNLLEKGGKNCSEKKLKIYYIKNEHLFYKIFYDFFFKFDCAL